MLKQALLKDQSFVLNRPQHTVMSTVVFEGVGVHSGRKIQMHVKPASVGTGIHFVRTDIAGANRIPARWDLVTETHFCTKISNPEGVSVSTIEHLMAALYACEIDNAVIELNGPEVPIMDGSSALFIEKFGNTGLLSQCARKPVIEIYEPLRVENDHGWVTLEPAAGFEIDYTIHFEGRANLPPQTYHYQGQIDSFSKEIASARTFGFLDQVEKLWAAGLAKGGSLANAVVIDGDHVVNAEGFRYPDECVRHKVLDAVGDLYLAGVLFKGRFKSMQGGHELHNKLLRKLFAHKNAWAFLPDPTLVPILRSKAASIAASLVF